MGAGEREILTDMAGGGVGSSGGGDNVLPICCRPLTCGESGGTWP